MDNFDSTCNVIKRSGRQVRKSATKDLKKVVNELSSRKAMHATQGQRYEIFKNFPRTLLSGFDIHTQQIMAPNELPPYETLCFIG